MEITSISSFLDYYASIRARTERLLSVVPPDKLEYTYKAGKFTIADQIRHIAAIERYMFGETLAGRPSRYADCGYKENEFLHLIFRGSSFMGKI